MTDHPQTKTKLGVIEAGDGTESFVYQEIGDLEDMTIKEVESIWDLGLNAE